MIAVVFCATTWLTASPAGAAEGAGANGTTVTDSERELAERYVPFVDVQTQTVACGPGEPYLPTDAISLVGHPDVVLRDERGQVVANGPTAADLAAAPNDWHVDFPGNALQPGCDFERWFRANGDPTASVYARVAADPERPDRLALQYWFFWIYNDWNNLHEGDWEMVQILFDAATPEEALATQPTEMVVAQHEGAERGPWSNVVLADGRPVVFPAGGSHATFFEQGFWLGKSASAGFGCDDTRGPSTRHDPSIIMLPRTVDPDGEFAWVGWRGRWGEQRPSFSNGPEGPIAKTPWDNPITWTEQSARTSSLRIPAVQRDVTDLFCRTTSTVSVVIVRLFDNPLAVTAALLGLAAAVVLLARRTAWNALVEGPIAQPRRSGQILRSAWTLLRLDWRRFVPVAGLVILGGLAAGLLRWGLGLLPFVEDLELLMSGDSIAGVVLALSIGALVSVPFSIAAVSLGVALTADLDTPAPATGSERHTTRSGLLTIAAIITLGFVLLGFITFLLGVFLVARWAGAPTLAARGRGFSASLRESSALTRGRRRKTATVVVAAEVVAVLTGPFVAGLVLVATGVSFGLVNLVASLITAMMLPWLAIVIVMVHGDLVSRQPA